MIGEFVLYIDLATGSAMIQFLIGGLAGALITVKIFWGSIKLKIGKLFEKK